jgi:hypothetical protein
MDDHSRIDAIILRDFSRRSTSLPFLACAKIWWASMVTRLRPLDRSVRYNRVGNSGMIGSRSSQSPQAGHGAGKT